MKILVWYVTETRLTWEERQCCSEINYKVKTSKYRSAICCRSITSSPLPKTRELGTTKATRNFVIIWIKYNISATVPKKRDDNPQTQVDPHTGQTGNHRKIEIERVQKRELAIRR